MQQYHPSHCSPNKCNNKQELYFYLKLMQLAGLSVMSIEKTTRKEYWLPGRSVRDREDSKKRHKI